MVVWYGSAGGIRIMRTKREVVCAWIHVGEMRCCEGDVERGNLIGPALSPLLSPRCTSLPRLLDGNLEQRLDSDKLQTPVAMGESSHYGVLGDHLWQWTLQALCLGLALE